MSAPWERARELFEGALEVRADERRGWLERACGEDAELLEEVASLLEHARQATGVIVPPSRESSVRVASGSQASAPFERVGPYRVERLIASGGMGSVWLGRRDDAAFEKTVAIKFVHRELAAPSILARFQRERELLARLEHPGIARLLDGGTTADGAPYLVMEYVEGAPIDAFADSQRLDVRGRLELFAAACDAVSFAHGQNVVHRDIKPGNLLVTPDGRPVLLDFGIAKLVTSEGELDGTLTRTGETVLSPRYASPEQCLGREVGPASDVYSLGVLLYELMTGRVPYAPTGASLIDLHRAVCESEPARASRAVRSEEPTLFARESATNAAEIAAGRRADVGGLARALSGDLDHVLRKALAKEPERRYRSVALLADDVRRHLAGRPILARPPSLAYRARKYAARNRLLVGASAAVVASLGAGLFVSLDQRGRALHAQERAESEAERAGRRSEQVREIAGELIFDLHSAIRDLPGSAPAQELALTRGLEYLDELVAEAGDDHDLLGQVAAAYLRLGSLFGAGNNLRLGLDQEAEHSARAALELYGRMSGPAGDPLASALGSAEAHRMLALLASERGEEARAIEALEQSRECSERAAALGADPAELLGARLSVESLRAQLELRAGAAGAALARLETLDAALEGEATDGVDPAALASYWSARGRALVAMSRHREALPFGERALATAEEALARDPNAGALRDRVHDAQVDLADVLRFVGEFERALGLCERALAHKRAWLEIDRTNRVAWWELFRATQLAGALAMNLGELEHAGDLQAEGVRVADELAGLWPGDPALALAAATARSAEAEVRVGLGDWAALVSLCEEALERYDAAQLDFNMTISRCATVGFLARGLCNLERTDEALEVSSEYTECARELQAAQPENPVAAINVINSLDVLGTLYGRMADDAGAPLGERIRLLEQSIELYEENMRETRALIEAGAIPPQAQATVDAVGATVESYAAWLEQLRAEQLRSGRLPGGD